MRQGADGIGPRPGEPPVTGRRMLAVMCRHRQAC